MTGPPEPVYFLDRDLGLRFSIALKAAGLQVERADDHFRNTTPDEEWLPEVGRRGWVALTRDERIRYSPLAQTALMTSGAHLFVIVGKLTADEAAIVFLRHRLKVERLVASHSQAFIAKVRRDRVIPWLRHAEWVRRR